MSQRGTLDALAAANRFRIGSDFRFSGRYRVQSEARTRPSSLAGTWLIVRTGASARRLNDWLQVQPDARPSPRVALRPAFVEARTGAFAQWDDALYYAGGFSSLKRRPRADILDVSKLAELWRRRLPAVMGAFERRGRALLGSLLQRPIRAAVNEYLCHEAGHRLGVPIHEKLDTGYFRPAGRMLWPLAYVEEFRADLLSLRAARDLLGPEDAAAVFAYQLLHRLGLAMERHRSGRSQAGAVPFLLFEHLREIGVLRRVRSCLSLVPRTAAAIGRAMADSAAWAEAALLEPERRARDGLAAALSAARHYRRAHENIGALREFRAVLSRTTPSG